jgi:hypothetical protein
VSSYSTVGLSTATVADRCAFRNAYLVFHCISKDLMHSGVPKTGIGTSMGLTPLVGGVLLSSNVGTFPSVFALLI